MQALIHRLLDTLFPPRESELLVRSCAASDLLALCAPRKVADTTTLLPYEHPLVRALIRENKFHNNAHAQRLLATVVRGWLEAQTEAVILVPIPLSAEREKTRGHNQVLSVLKASTKKLAHRINTKWLQRTIDTKPQADLSRAARIKNVTGAFAIKKSAAMSTAPTATVVLVDDVLTTGSTMAAARAALAPHLPPTSQLHCLAFAH